jgi:hypothetical protein
MWYGVQAAWEIGVASVAGVMLKLYYAVLDLWERLSADVMDVWDGAVNWVAKRLIDLQGLVDDSLDTEAVKQALDADVSARTGERGREKDASRQRLSQERDAAVKQLDQEHEQNLARLGQAAIDAERRLDAEGQKKVDAAQAELEAAKREWQEAIGEARKKRQLTEAEGPQQLQRPPEIPDYLEGLGSVIEQAQQALGGVGVAGTFSALEARGLGAGGVTDRIAKASEETAQNTKRLVQEAQIGQLAFE